LWDHYGEVRAYETVMATADVTTLHALRIASKSLRYAQEFFREVLEPVVGASKQTGIGYTIEAVVALQDHIGNLHDADLTIARLHAFLQAGAKHKPGLPAKTVKAARRYLKAKQAELKQLHTSAAEPWGAVSSPKFRKILGKAVAGL
jgi:CHAD domain-containing protein